MSNASKSSTAARRSFFRLNYVRDRRTEILARLAALSPDSRNGDLELLVACADFAVLEQRQARILQDTYRGNHSKRRSPEIARLESETNAILRRIADAPATTLLGHSARAAVFLLQDGGDLLQRVVRHGLAEDRILAAHLLDLLDVLIS